MGQTARTCGILFLIVVIFAFGMGGGVAIDRAIIALFPKTQDAPATSGLNTKLIQEAYDKIQRNYVDRPAVDASRLTYGSISGMVDTLGDTGHTSFLTPEMVKQQSTLIKGSFEGIGAEVTMKDGHVVIVAPFDGSPAQKAGLKPGFIILKVDQQDMAGQSLSEVVSHILGPAGTTVVVTAQDPQSGEVRDYKIIRARIEIHNVTWQMLPGTKIADIRLAGFSQNVTKDLQQALKDARQAGASGLILDLRNNPGGLLSESIGVASQFLPDGTVLQEKDAKGNIKKVPVETGGVAVDLPMVVLTNPGTASASEIVSGALQDAGRAKLVGEKTFGTGTVLNEFPLSDGSALLLATEEWLTPKGRVIWHQGIIPDVQISLPTGVSPLTPEGISGMDAQAYKASQDTQLLKAVDLLTN